eukprot:scaffold68366_cov53-Attheya_sp.AAC.1
MSAGLRAGKLRKWCKEIRIPFKTRLRAVLEGISKIITEEDKVWETSSVLRRKPTSTLSDLAPRAKRLRPDEPEVPVVELQQDFQKVMSHSHDSTDQTQEKANHVPKVVHNRTKDWYNEESNVEDDAKEKKATKSDDAAVPIELWNDRIVEKVFGIGVSEERKKTITKSLDSIRKFGLYFWRRKVARDFRAWWIKYAAEERSHNREPRRELLDAGIESLRYAAGASWWQWDSGSAPFFWRWEEEFLEDLATGYKPMFKKIPQTSKAS